MRQRHSCDKSRLAVLSGNTEVSAAGAMRVVIDIQNELLLKLHQLDRLTNLSAFWDFAIRLNEGTNLLASRHHNVTFRRVNVDTFGLLLVAYDC